MSCSELDKPPPRATMPEEKGGRGQSAGSAKDTGMGKTSFGANEAPQSTATPVVEPRPAEGNHVAEVFA
jgi:hypothetical protein